MVWLQKRGADMFGLIDMIICFAFASVLSSFVVIFMVGAIIINREEEAYRNGYKDGKEAGGENE